MKTLDINTSVGDLVREDPARSRIFEKLGLDYCCGGKRPLAEACQSKGLDPDTVLAMLSAMEDGPDSTLPNPDTLSLSELCDHIEQVHHGYLRQELPRLDFMTQKVAAVHGEQEPRLLKIRGLFESFYSEIASHTNDEEKNIFPTIRSLDEGKEKSSASNLKSSLEKLESEHASAGAALAQFNQLTDNYTPPEWACNTFRALYDALHHLETDMHLHVHKENNVLFPKVTAKLQGS